MGPLLVAKTINMNISLIQKVEQPAYNKEDKYFIYVDLSEYRVVQVSVSFKEIEPLILHLHALGIMGSRRYSSTADSHLTEWHVPKDTKPLI